MPFDKDPNQSRPKLLIVGEAWGEKEDMMQHALVGPSGVLLARSLYTSKLTSYHPEAKYPSELDMIRYWNNVQNGTFDCDAPLIYIANVFNERPEENQIDLFFATDGDQTYPPYKRGQYIRKDKLHHLFGLYSLIRTIKPNLVLALGNTPTWALLGKTQISKIRGSVEWSPICNVKVLATYHPAAVLRDWSLRTVLVADINKAEREVRFPEIQRIKRYITCHDHRLSNDAGRITIDEIADWFKNPINLIACDIESGYALFEPKEINKLPQGLRYIISSQISMVGFARDPYNALVIPFMDRNEPDLSYWRTRSDEVWAWKFTMRALATKVPKIFQNGMYDVGRFLAMGIPVRNAIKDSMIKHHALYPELQKSLGFLGSVYTNEIAWKNMYANKSELKKDE